MKNLQGRLSRIEAIIGARTEARSPIQIVGTNLWAEIVWRILRVNHDDCDVDFHRQAEAELAVTRAAHPAEFELVRNVLAKSKMAAVTLIER